MQVELLGAADAERAAFWDIQQLAECRDEEPVYVGPLDAPVLGETPLPPVYLVD
jgi:hypothetical protein